MPLRLQWVLAAYKNVLKIITTIEPSLENVGTYRIVEHRVSLHNHNLQPQYCKNKLYVLNYLVAAALNYHLFCHIPLCSSESNDIFKNTLADHYNHVATYRIMRNMHLILNVQEQASHLCPNALCISNKGS